LQASQFHRAAQQGGAEQSDGTMTEYENVAPASMRQAPQAAVVDNNSPMLSQVVGIIIGSPEFQRK
jgi:hypothetical protein